MARPASIRTEARRASVPLDLLEIRAKPTLTNVRRIRVVMAARVPTARTRLRVHVLPVLRGLRAKQTKTSARRNRVKTAAHAWTEQTPFRAPVHRRFMVRDVKPQIPRAARIAARTAERVSFLV